ncbi:MAG: lactate utilization protein [Proteobacteria bacterium]|nr:lactate utilization protein [Pseudomonadota bacterium]
MENLIHEKYWLNRLNRLKKALEKNNFEVFLASTPSEAKDVALKEIIPRTQAKTISMGDSLTAISTGIFAEIKNQPNLNFLDTFEPGIPFEVAFERRRQALLVDLFITGTNAVTQKGQLVNLDMIGNRVGGITFGPKNVIILVGRNKLVPDLETAMDRVRTYAAPVNAIRHQAEHPELDPPCTQTGICANCTHPLRICNTWTITEKSFPPGRIKIVLINEDMGL